jgi:pyruvate,water dikinase
MKKNPTFTELRFDAPGPGPWELERTHFTRPVSRFAADPLTRGMPRGFAEGSERYGNMLSHLKPAWVHGFMYAQAVVHGAPEGASGPPPKPLLWLLMRLHPQMRARVAKQRRAFETKQWRKDLEQWDRVDRPRATERNLAIQAVNPALLDKEGLVDHLRRAQANMEDMMALHHRHNPTCGTPIGDYLAHTQEWTGASAAEVLALLQGTSPMARGVAAEELETLGKALRASEAGREVLARKGDAQSVLDALAAMEGDIGAAMHAYLDLVRYRSIGYDVSDKNGGELPEMLLRAIRSTVGGARGAKALAEREAKEKALRERVPPAHRAQFDEMLVEARLVNRLRDERGLYSDSWGTGLGRRAVLEAGRRLVAAGKLEDAEHAVDLTLDEMIGLLRDQIEPSLAEVTARALRRTTMTMDDAPPWLNMPPGSPPPISIFPAPARRLAKATDALLANMFQDSEARHSDKVVRGTSINAGVYEGTARLVIDPGDFGKIQKGDVLVTASTSAYFNVVLPLLGAIVTDRGGQLSHAAIVAREYGIPGIVGTRDATVTIPDRARVRVDGATGEVTILSVPERRAQEVALAHD